MAALHQLQTGWGTMVGCSLHITSINSKILGWDFPLFFRWDSDWLLSYVWSGIPHDPTLTWTLSHFINWELIWWELTSWELVSWEVDLVELTSCELISWELISWAWISKSTLPFHVLVCYNSLAACTGEKSEHCCSQCLSCMIRPALSSILCPGLVRGTETPC